MLTEIPAISQNFQWIHIVLLFGIHRLWGDTTSITLSTKYTNLEIMYNKMKSAPVLHIEQVAHLFLNVLFCIIGTH